MPLKKLNNINSNFAIFIIVTSIFIPVIFFLEKGGDDISYHALWIKLFSKQFLAGNYNVNWLFDINNGFGGPDFYFYPKLPYIFASVHSFFSNIFANEYSSIWYSLLFSCYVAFVVSGITFTKLLKKIIPKSDNARLAIIIGCSIFFLNYKHFYSELIFASSPSQVWAWAFIPLLFYYTIKISELKKLSLIKYAISFYLLINSNLPATVITVYSCGVLYLCLLNKLYLKQILYFIVANIFAVALAYFKIHSLIFLLPEIHTNQLLNGKYNALTYVESYSINFSYISIIMPLLIAIIMSLIIIASKKLAKQKSRVISGFMTITAIIIFLLTPYSAFIWTYLPYLQNIQFPARLLIIASISLAVIVTTLISLSEIKNYNILPIIALISFCISLQTALSTDRKGINEKTSNLLNMSRFSKNINDRQDYLPKHVNINNFRKTIYDTYPNKLAWSVDSNVTVRKSHIDYSKAQININVLNNSTEHSYITVRQFYFPTWTTKENFVIDKTKEGLLKIKIPRKYKGKITLYHKNMAI